MSFADDSLISSVSDDNVFNDTGVSGISDAINASAAANISDVINTSGFSDRSTGVTVSNITSSISDRVENEASRKRSHAELLRAYNTGERRFEKGAGLAQINNEVVQFKPVSRSSDSK